MRIVVDGFDVSAVGVKGVTLVRTTTPKGFQRPKRRQADLGAGGGMFAEQLKAGSMVNGLRVVGMTTGLRGCRQWVRVQLADGSWSGLLFHGERVPGTVVRTDFLAGPVGSGRGMKANRVGRGDGESPGDRHSRLVDSIQYA